MDIEQRNSLLDTKIDSNTTVREASGTSFVAWALNKVNGLSSFNVDVQSIVALSSAYPGRVLTEEQKLEVMVKLQKLNAL